VQETLADVAAAPWQEAMSSCALSSEHPGAAYALVHGAAVEDCGKCSVLIAAALLRSWS
jgi:hypothetical protein